MEELHTLTTSKSDAAHPRRVSGSLHRGSLTAASSHSWAVTCSVARAASPWGRSARDPHDPTRLLDLALGGLDQHGLVDHDSATRSEEGGTQCRVADVASRHLEAAAERCEIDVFRAFCLDRQQPLP